MSTNKLTAQHLDVIGERTRDQVLTLGELVALADELKLPLSQIVVGEAMSREGKSYDEVIDAVLRRLRP